MNGQRMKKIDICYMMLYDVIWCYMMLYDVIWCYMMLYDVIWCYMMLYDVLCNRKCMQMPCSSLFYIFCSIMWSNIFTAASWLVPRSSTCFRRVRIAEPRACQMMETSRESWNFSEQAQTNTTKINQLTIYQYLSIPFNSIPFNSIPFHSTRTEPWERSVTMGTSQAQKPGPSRTRPAQSWCPERPCTPCSAEGKGSSRPGKTQKVWWKSLWIALGMMMDH